MHRMCDYTYPCVRRTCAYEDQATQACVLPCTMEQHNPNKIIRTVNTFPDDANYQCMVTIQYSSRPIVVLSITVVCGVKTIVCAVGYIHPCRQAHTATLSSVYVCTNTYARVYAPLRAW